MRSPLLAAACVVFLTSVCAGTPREAGFSETVFVNNTALAQATGFAWAPDGSNRLFVALKGGAVRVIKDGALLPTPFATETVTTSSECGLIGLAFDPAFATNGHVFLFLTVSSSEQQIVRYTASGDVGSARTLIKSGLPTRGNNHDGGALGIGADGKLYWAVGDLGDATGVDADLSSLAAKVGRANLDGSAATDNPFYDAADGITAKDFIFARGFRNPFTMTFHPVTGELWLNVVGTSYEQIFLVRSGDHAGWNDFEGGNQPTGYIRPKLSYSTNGSPYGGCITGGVFYGGALFPSTHQHNFFWGDYNAGKIMRSVLDSTHTTITSTSEFVTGVTSVVDINEGPDGALYYVGRSGGNIYRLGYTTSGTPPNLQLSVTSLQVTEGGQATFTVRLSAQPSASMLVSVARSSGDTDVTATPVTLTFTSSDWDTPQTVTVAVAHDGDTDNDGAAIRVSATGVTAQDVAVTVLDDDIDPVAPSAHVTSPAPGATVSGMNAEWYGDGTDDTGTTRAEFYIDGALAFADQNTTGHYHLGGAHNLWDTTLLADGEHTLRMTVFDDDGLSGSHEITVTVQNTTPPANAPSVQILSPVNGATVSYAIAWYGDVTGGEAVTRAELHVDGALVYADATSATRYRFGGSSGLWDTTTVSDGDHHLRITVYDSDGLAGSHQIGVTVDNDVSATPLTGFSGEVSSTGCGSCAASNPELGLLLVISAWVARRRRRGAGAGLALALLALAPDVAVAQSMVLAAETDAPPRNYVNLRAGASTSALHPQICLDVAPVAFLSLEACGTGSGFLHDDAEPEVAHFRVETTLQSWRTEAGWLEARVGAGFAELQVGADDAGFNFRGVGANANATAGPELSASLRGLVPLSDDLELVWDVDAGGAFMQHAPELRVPRSRLQLSLGATLGVGF